MFHFHFKKVGDEVSDDNFESLNFEALNKNLAAVKAIFKGEIKRFSGKNFYIFPFNLT